MVAGELAGFAGDGLLEMVVGRPDAERYRRSENENLEVDGRAGFSESCLQGQSVLSAKFAGRARFARGVVSRPFGRKTVCLAVIRRETIGEICRLIEEKKKSYIEVGEGRVFEFRGDSLPLRAPPRNRIDRLEKYRLQGLHGARFRR